jgi:uncharacterized protein YggT (Ycf19 family)
MAAVHLILNCICLLLWLNWRSKGLHAIPNRPPALSLIGTLRRAGGSPQERWSSSVMLLGALLLRAFFYDQAASNLRWVPQISLMGFVLHFRPKPGDHYSYMLVFSIISFLIFLGAFSFCVLLIAAVNGKDGEANYWNAFVRAYPGILGRLPSSACLLLPFVLGFVFWLAIGFFLALIQVHQPIRSFAQLCGQATVVGLASWLVWGYAIGAVLILHVLSSYVYFGNAPFWSFISITARNLLRPLSSLPLRFGKVDLAPLLALALLGVLAWWAPAGLEWIYRRLGV